MTISRIRIVLGVDMEKNCKKYIWLHGFRSQLSKKLGKKDGLLNVMNQSDLWDKLSAGYSFLTISDGAAVEIVRVEQFGSSIKITRGQENTQAQAFPSGACVFWEVTRCAVQAVMENDAMEKDDCGCGE